MPNAPTPNLGLTVPTVGGDFNIWGNELNTDLFILDNLGKPSTVSTSTDLPVTFGNFPETFILATSGVLGVNIFPPAAASFPGRILTVKKVDAGIAAVNIAPVAGLIDGNSTYQLTNQYQYVRMLSDGANWQIVGNN